MCASCARRDRCWRECKLVPRPTQMTNKELGLVGHGSLPQRPGVEAEVAARVGLDLGVRRASSGFGRKMCWRKVHVLFADAIQCWALDLPYAGYWPVGTVLQGNACADLVHPGGILRRDTFEPWQRIGGCHGRQRARASGRRNIKGRQANERTRCIIQARQRQAHQMADADRRQVAQTVAGGHLGNHGGNRRIAGGHGQDVAAAQ